MMQTHEIELVSALGVVARNAINKSLLRENNNITAERVEQRRLAADIIVALIDAAQDCIIYAGTHSK